MKKIIIVCLLCMGILSLLAVDKIYALSPDVNTTLINVDKQSYSAGIDKNTGTIYQFNNKRSNASVNTVQENPGAALQIAIHSGAKGSLTAGACAQQGYWNPTQAGAACSYPYQPTGTIWHKTPIAGSGYDVYCDGVKNNNCQAANNKIEHSLFPLMNFDYGPSYEGPYNSNDLLYLKQETNAKDNYLLIDQTIINKGIDRSAAVEIPTYYFIDAYRKYYYEGTDGTIKAEVLSQNTLSENRLQTIGNFISVEDPQVPNSAITVAWFYSKEFDEDISLEYYYSFINSAPYNGIDYVKFTNAPRVNLHAQKTYKVRYVIIPYRYDEEIETEYGKTSVRDFIKQLDYPTNNLAIDTGYNNSVPYISPGYSMGNFLSNTNNQILLGLKSGQIYTTNQSVGKVYFSSAFLPPDKKIKGIEFDYETNYDNNYLFAAIDIPGSQFFWKEDNWGAKIRTGIRLDFPPSDWVAFGLYTKDGFSYNQPDNNWHFLIKNLKFYYYDDNPTPTPLPGDINSDGKVNIFDYNILLQNFGNTTCGNVADIDGNCKVDIFDYNILVGNFGK